MCILYVTDGCDVPIKKDGSRVIFCGLITSETDDDYVLMTDIQGLSFFGDMDFKVTGTTESITAIRWISRFMV